MPRVIAVIGSAFALYAATVLGEGVVTNQFKGSIFEDSAVVVYQSFLSYLVSGVQALLALGIILVLGGWLAGRTNSAQLRPWPLSLAGLNEIADRTGWDTGSRFAPYAPIIRWAVVVIWLAVLLSGNYLGSFSGILFTLFMAGIWTGLEILIRARTTIEVVVLEQNLETEVPDQA